jgi:2-hydroxychromene-2-carboxylate isomerase
VVGLVVEPGSARGDRRAVVLTLYHDIPSAGSLVAMLRLQRLADEGLPVGFRGFDVLGLDATMPATLDDLEDWQTHGKAALALGWELPRPRRHPSTLRTHLIGELAAEQGRDAAWRLAVYRAHWLEDQDLGDVSVLVEVAAGVGLDADEVGALLDDGSARHRLRQRMLVRRGEGVGGVPVLDANGTYLSPFVPEEDLRALAAL